MVVRFKFDADLYIEGDDMREIRNKFESIPLFSNEAIKCGAEFGELFLVEDGDTNEDLMKEYNNV